MSRLPPSPARRRWLRRTGAGLACALAPAAWLSPHAAPTERGCATGDAFAQPLFVPGDAGRMGRLGLGDAPLALAAVARDDALAFAAEAGGRPYSNPTLVAGAGARVRVTVGNALPEPTVVHWHGLVMDTRNDGNGEALIAPKDAFAYDFVVRNRAGLYWYHPHPHGATARQVYRGLYGLIEVQDEEDAALRRALDLVPGATELALVLQDRRAGDGYRYAPAPEDELLGWYGCVPEVNGVRQPFHDVAARRYRLRILNAANARTYRLAFRRAGGAPLPVVLAGTDGGLLAQPASCREVLLSPAERVDLLVDFAGLPRGESVVMESRAFDPVQAVRAPAPRDAAPDPHGHAGGAPATSEGAPFDLVQFRVRDGAAGAGPRVPGTLSRLPAPVVAQDDPRPLRLGFAKGRWRINDRVYERDETPLVVARGARETWLLRNYHASAPHAMHLHGFQFRVLERETSPDWLAPLAVDTRGRLPTDLGGKDTVLVWPGESVRIAIDFTLPFADGQVYLVHCHNLEHEDAGMMLRVRVG